MDQRRFIEQVENHRSVFGGPASNSGAQPTTFRQQEIAQRVMNEGTPFTRREARKGTRDGGPYSVLYTGARWGQVFLELTPGGALHLYAWVSRKRQPLWPFRFHYTLISCLKPWMQPPHWLRSVRAELDDLRQEVLEYENEAWRFNIP